MHVALTWNVTLLLALLIDGTISTTLNLSATAKATFQVYTLPGCGEVGKNGQQTTIYHVPGTECVDTPPIPEVDDRFLSYTATVNTGAAGSICFFDVFPYKNCTGSYSGFFSGEESEIFLLDADAVTDDVGDPSALELEASWFANWSLETSLS
ncbi:hypothetical protein MMC22_005210 [Lobaria immixta]|nr:hypothetical protein [Lobaria immixta]